MRVTSIPFKGKISLWKLQRRELARIIQLHSQEYFQGRTVLSSFEPLRKEKLISDFDRKIGEILKSSDPIAESRKALVEYVTMFARLQAACLTESEMASQFYGGSPYISGQLWRHIRHSSAHIEELGRIRREHPEYSDDDLIRAANARCELYLYYAEGLNMIRMELGDRAENWYRPFIEASLISEEHRLREKLGLPTLVPGPLGWLTYRAFPIYVRKERNPLPAWAQAFPDARLSCTAARQLASKAA